MYRFGSMESRVVRNADKELCPVGQVLGFRHVLLTASNRRVITVASPFGFINGIIVICFITIGGSALGARSSELRDSQSSCRNSAHSGRQLCYRGQGTAGLSRALCGFSSTHELKMLLFLGGVNFAYSSGE